MKHPQRGKHLEIGIGTGQRLKHVVAQRRHAVVVGIDKKARATRGRIKGARLVLGKKGDVKTFLLGAIRRGEKFGEINAEYFFDSLVLEPNVGNLLFRGASFESIFSETHAKNLEREKRVSEILGLIRRVLGKNGILRLEVRKDSLRKNLARLRKHGFSASARRLKPEEVKGRQGRIYLVQAQKGDVGLQPYEIIAITG